MKTEKKSERIEVRVGFKEKREFADACDSQGDTPSGAVRRFIRGYVRRADADVRSGAFRRMLHVIMSPLRRHVMRPAFLSGSGLIIAIAFALFYLQTSENTAYLRDLKTAYMAYDQRETVMSPAVPPLAHDPNDVGPALEMDVFEKWDRNSNGVIERGEILPNDFHLHRVLDINSTGIEPHEFWAEGEMHYRIVAESQPYARLGAAVEIPIKKGMFRGKGKVHIVRYDLTGEVPMISISILSDDSVGTRLDRTLIWEVGAKTPNFQMNDWDYRARRSPEAKI